ncbi:MAG: Type IV pilus assembly protein PilM [Parcubacteria group bacterium GW2011_GWA2_49_9]|nr:MAG: Type IV pilus assembly protein PilM [Parcubacteria group bacterium GW2011_GWA2_49_9]
MQNPFPKLAGFFRQTFQSADTSVVGVDIGSAYIKVVQLRRKSGKAVLETYGSLAIGPYGGVEIGRATHLPPEKIAEALRDLLREAHVTSTSAAFAIPFASSLVTTMDMRVLDPKQLRTIVPIEARKYIPVPISEVNLDWWIIPDEPERVSNEETRTGEPGQAVQEETQQGGQEQASGSAAETGLPPLPENGAQPTANESGAPKDMKILIAAIHNEAMSRYGEVVKQSGLTSSFFEIELFSTIRALFPQDLLPHAVLDLGAGETKLYIIDRGLIRTSHIINHGGQDITLALSRSLGITVAEAEKKKRDEGILQTGDETEGATAILNVVCGETNRVLENFERKFGRKVVDVVLTGGGANLPGLEALAEQTMSVPSVRANPFKQTLAPAFLDEVLRGVGPEFTVAVGIAFRKLQEGS